MKITTTYLRQVIKEEIEKVLEGREADAEEQGIRDTYRYLRDNPGAEEVEKVHKKMFDINAKYLNILRRMFSNPGEPDIRYIARIRNFENIYYNYKYGGEGSPEEIFKDYKALIEKYENLNKDYPNLGKDSRIEYLIRATAKPNLEELEAFRKKLGEKIENAKIPQELAFQTNRNFGTGAGKSNFVANFLGRI